jgi:hypothetical protein
MWINAMPYQFLKRTWKFAILVADPCHGKDSSNDGDASAALHDYLDQAEGEATG